MTLSFDTTSAEKPDPSLYLRKREGSPSGLKPAPKQCASPRAAGSPRSAAALQAPSGSPTAGGKPQRSSLFWRMYDRGDLPVRVEQARHNTIRWTADLAAVDLHYYLPVFVDGLLEVQVGAGGAGQQQSRETLIQWVPCAALAFQVLQGGKATAVEGLSGAA
jgi:hypothetical protein